MVQMIPVVQWMELHGAVGAPDESMRLVRMDPLPPLPASAGDLPPAAGVGWWLAERAWDLGDPESDWGVERRVPAGTDATVLLWHAINQVCPALIAELCEIDKLPPGDPRRLLRRSPCAEWTHWHRDWIPVGSEYHPPIANLHEGISWIARGVIGRGDNVGTRAEWGWRTHLHPSEKAALCREYGKWAMANWQRAPQDPGDPKKWPSVPVPPLQADPIRVTVASHWARGADQIRYAIESRRVVWHVGENVWRPGAVETVRVDHTKNGNWSTDTFDVRLGPETELWTFTKSTRNQLWRSLSSSRGYSHRWEKGSIRRWEDIPESFRVAFRYFLPEKAGELDAIAAW